MGVVSLIVLVAGCLPKSAVPPQIAVVSPVVTTPVDESRPGGLPHDDLVAWSSGGAAWIRDGEVVAAYENAAVFADDTVWMEVLEPAAALGIDCDCLDNGGDGAACAVDEEGTRTLLVDALGGEVWPVAGPLDPPDAGDRFRDWALEGSVGPFLFGDAQLWTGTCDADGEIWEHEVDVIDVVTGEPWPEEVLDQTLLAGAVVHAGGVLIGRPDALVDRGWPDRIAPVFDGDELDLAVTHVETLDVVVGNALHREALERDALWRDHLALPDAFEPYVIVPAAVSAWARGVGEPLLGWSRVDTTPERADILLEAFVRFVGAPADPEADE